jgi:hypothetical protein
MYFVVHQIFTLRKFKELNFSTWFVKNILFEDKNRDYAVCLKNAVNFIVA